MLNIFLIEKHGCYHDKIKSRIVIEFLEDEPKKIICRRHHIDSRSIEKLYLYASQDNEIEFCRSRIGLPSVPVLDKMTESDKSCLLAMSDQSEDLQIQKNSRIILSAFDYYSFLALAKDFDVCSKYVKKIIERFKIAGPSGLRKRKTGPNSGLLDNDNRNLLEKTAEEIMLRIGSKKVNDSELAEAVGWSAGKVQKLLKGRFYVWRRFAAVKLTEIQRVAKDHSQSVIGINKLAASDVGIFVKTRDKVSLRCHECRNERKILVHTLKYNKPNCPHCQIGRSKGLINIAQTLVVRLVEAWCKYVYSGNALFFHDITPPYIRAAGRLFRVDGFCEELGIVVEYNGPHHDGPVRYSGMTEREANEKHEQTKENDLKKTGLCEESPHQLITVHDIKQALIKRAIPAIIAAFNRAGTASGNKDIQVPTEHEMWHVVDMNPGLFSGQNTTDRKIYNSMCRIVDGKSSICQEGRRLNRSRSTIYRLLRTYKNSLGNGNPMSTV